MDTDTIEELLTLFKERMPGSSEWLSWKLLEAAAELSKQAKARRMSAKTVHWMTKKDGQIIGEDVERLPNCCPACGAYALTRLPSWEQAKQTDDTNVVCNPALDGCNQGYSLAL